MKKAIIAVVIILVCCVLLSCALVALGIVSLPLAWSDDRSCVSNSSQVRLLKSYVPKETLDSVDPQFYTYFGFRDWWRYPLVYPYSIHAIDSLDDGYLVDESPITDYEADSINNATQLFDRIQAFTFDKNYLLAIRDNDFILFEFETGTWSSFETKQELIDEAKRLQFEGDFKFMTLQEYDALFVCGQ
ncbi:MAG: hypothetical protein JW730_10570 [Anaerolineales bacterium]|nr:hypothetical protein [Anaerolineales bacterium]